MVTPHFELEIRPASDFCQLAGFCCGLEEMDNFIHSRLATCDQIHFVNTYFVFHGAEVIALFSLSTGSVILDSDDFEDIQMGARNRMHSLEFTMVMRPVSSGIELTRWSVASWSGRDRLFTSFMFITL